MGRVDLEVDTTELARGLRSAPKIPGADEHGMAEIDQASGCLVAEALIGAGDQRDGGHCVSLQASYSGARMHLSAGIADCADLRIVPTVARYAFRSGRFLLATLAQSRPGVSENSRRLGHRPGPQWHSGTGYHGHRGDLLAGRALKLAAARLDA